MSNGRHDVGGMVLGRYRIVHELARGGMGIVYLARVEGAAGFTRPVVVKRVLAHMAEDPEALGFFAREARILSQLHHPNIVNVVDFGEDGSEYIMVLEYVRGYHLGQWHTHLVRQERTLPLQLTLLIIGRVLDALEYAHTFKQPDGTATPIIHRDVSPGNILLDTQGHIKLLDFGIARIEGTGEHRTREGTFKGKLPFSAPELFHGEAPSVKTDLYSCGVLLYMLLSNVNPFRGNTRKETLYRVMNHTPPPVSSLRDDAPEALDELVSRAIAREPEQRFASAGEFAQALRELQSRPSEELQGELATILEEDFLGEMPERLGLQQLRDLDVAWRNAGNAPSVSSIDGDATETIVGEIPQAASRTEQPAGIEGATAAEPERAKSSSRLWLTIIGALAAIGAVAIVAWRFLPSQTQSEPEVIVIEKESSETPAPPPSSVGGEAAGSPSPTGSEPTASPAQSSSARTVDSKLERTPAAGSKGADTRAAVLSRRFQSNQSRVQECFTTHASDIEGSPQVTLRFRVAKNGSVTSASIAPPTLAGTALGRCLLGVARGAQFGAQPEPITFSIPITARRVR